ncbi:Rec A-like recombinase [Ralstonia phage phiRSL1]|uniref:Rec A-like recombinase n=1 Tax=Ralstonia phage phiRSL1 TaxID=1980924 RepID=B2ZYC0_9CAUD|nr:Rec A-like recombinase [Ralstonia phage phiRSL1]BAG41670.1 Rec A-like recombinase [Ralstonia phage phiRSL1]
MATKKQVKQKEAPAAKKGKRAAADAGDSPKMSKATFDYFSMMTDTMDEISKRQGVDTDLMDNVKPLSTGLLAYDLILGGGIRPAMYTSAGFEQGGKTTGAIALMAAAVKAGIPTAFWDYEGSTANSLDYVGNILQTMGVKQGPKELFGVKDPATGKWTTPPRVRYIAETRGEKFFDWLAEMLRDMPDKKFVANKWWLVFDESNKKHKAAYSQQADANMARKYGKGLWVPTEDGSLQALILVDSYPAMNPEANDNEEANNSLGLHARFFAKHLPRVKGRLAQKMVAMVGVNQLREVPMAMYGPKEKEACGQALRFNSDVRNWWNSRASGMPFNAKFDGEERVEIEPSADGGKDRYRYVQVVNKKNKLANPGRKMWVRIWVSDSSGKARGFDPFFDTMHYLQSTGQLTAKNRKNMFLDLEGMGAAKRSIDWGTLKKWVLGSKEEKTKISQALGYKPMDLRAFCFKQVATGKGERCTTPSRTPR